MKSPAQGQGKWHQVTWEKGDEREGGMRRALQRDAAWGGQATGRGGGKSRQVGRILGVYKEEQELELCKG